ncbi:hypothetical protein CPC08DRAFT_822034 [Agrocybe pediades]|nr:hypothetical protein CPC08DRAFT_822034 [Agrocybe pediades]
MLSSRPVQLNTDGVYHPTRTPGRGLKNRAENAYAGMGSAMTVNGKGKNANMPPRTPFQPASAQPKKFKDQKTVLSTIGRPLGDKTPLPNRINTILFKTPLPGGTKLSKLQDELEDGTPESAQRPSSLRKHIKQPRMSAGKALETPANNGRHWEEVSDGELAAPEVEPVLQNTVFGDDDDSNELEYAPPNTLDLPYEPPFDFALPNYTEVGKSLFELAYSVPVDDALPPVEIDMPASEIESIVYDLGPLPEPESDDPFVLARAESAAAKVTKPTTRRAPTIPAAKPRPQSSLARAAVTNATTRPASRAASSTVAATKKPASTVGPSKPISTAPRPKSRVAAANPSTISTKKVAAVKPERAPSAMSNIKSRVDSGLRRPHTALAVPSSTAPKQKQIGAAPRDALLAGLLAKNFVDDLADELDFQFEI